ncbi:MAG: hypothetical protein NC421_10775 [Lachnospiraceae bacterium]|nr:hypothetical protein [Lachnospiraceae bacterium]
MKSVFLCPIIAIFALMSCTKEGSSHIGAIYSSDEFTVYTDRVEQDGLSIIAMPLPQETTEESSRTALLPEYHSDQPIIDRLFSLAIKEIYDSIHSDNICYSTYLSLAALAPDKALRLLKKQIKDTHAGPEIIQPSGIGGSWPVATDRIAWAMAIWEIYKTTGDKSILTQALQAIENTLDNDMRAAWDDTHKLMRGAVTTPGNAMSHYPAWMDATDIYESMSLGTNVMFAHAFKVRDMMLAELPDRDFSPMWVGVDQEISNSLNTSLWIPNAGVYGQYLYGGFFPILSTANDNFAQALAIIFDIANPEMAKSIISRTPSTPWGITTIYPLINDSTSSPDVNATTITGAFWNIASAKARNMKAVEKGMGTTLRTAAFYAASKGVLNDSSSRAARYPESRVWNSPGIAAMVLRVIMGMDFNTDGISFNPIVPSSLPGEKRLSGLKYKEATLTVKIYGTGESIKTFSVNTVPQTDYFLPDTLKGDVTVEITMDNRPAKESKIENQECEFMPPTPCINWTEPCRGHILNDSGNVKYMTYLNSNLIETVKSDSVSFTPQGGYSLMDIVPVTESGITGFSCKPHEYVCPENTIIIPASRMSATGTALIADHKLAGKFVETTTRYNTALHFNVNVENDGDYLLDVRYCNGNGEMENGDKCALRLLYIDGAEAGAIVMPQQGAGKWDTPAFSNMIHVKLRKGTNHLSLRYSLDNMNSETNTALIQYARIIKQ